MIDKQECALEGLLKEMEKVHQKGLSINRVRMNFKTMISIFNNLTDIFYEAKERGSSDWPIGAFALIGSKYGKESYFTLDNSLIDGDVCIDTKK